MNLRRLKAIAKKEFIHVLRDPRSLMMGIGMPMILLFLFGYALTMDVERVPLAVWDQANSVESRELVSRFSGSRYFDLRITTDNYRMIEEAIDRRQALIALVIPPDFSRRLSRGETAVVQAIVDGSDPNTATIALGYADATALVYSRQIAMEQLLRAGTSLDRIPALDLTPRVWFNSDMTSRNFIFPGLIAVVMMIMGAILTSLCMAREWESGTMEQLIATPVTPLELIMGKLAPYFCIGILDLILCVGVGQFVFQVPLRGSLWLLTPLAMLFLFGALSFGILLSIITKSQLLASQLALVTTVLPAFLLSGFIFPIENMPFPIRVVTHIVTARYFVFILRGIYLKDVGLTLLWPEVLFLASFGLIVTLLAVGKFRKSID
ncbi:ABC transporter permease [Pelobacter propionicus]|uniref:ABC-2 type transporter n=1 Tax=Pelobacter propionicus (strain DSM 2379 / NBRC 103807 / OttBd1) TaxID=338966 RepID=A1AT33_PELPD|nr:ABC transporter permease [Pelobacter propionicus]ABL00504.1 ABC-2 type transporter [Pelobacter propionicus DSM 2379]